MLHGRAEHGPNSQVYDQLAGVVRSLLPVMERTGVARADTIDIDTLSSRLREEALARGATLVAPIFVGGCAEKPR
ncbi:MAG: hypothetical protein ACJ8KO_04925 [Sulfurifustaceae bacterium]